MGPVIAFPLRIIYWRRDRLELAVLPSPILLAKHDSRYDVCIRARSFRVCAQEFSRERLGCVSNQIQPEASKQKAMLLPAASPVLSALDNATNSICREDPPWQEIHWVGHGVCIQGRVRLPPAIKNTIRRDRGAREAPTRHLQEPDGRIIAWKRCPAG